MKSSWQQFLLPILPSAWSWPDSDCFGISLSGSNSIWSCDSSRSDGNILREIYHCVDRSDVQLEITLTRFPDQGACSSEICIINTGSQSCHLESLQVLRLSPHSHAGPIKIRECLGGQNSQYFPPNAFAIHDYTIGGGDGNNGSGSRWSEHGHNGRSSEDTLPFIMLAAGDDALMFALEWSGLWWHSYGGRSSDHLEVMASIPVHNLELLAGEKLQLPRAHMVFSKNGLDGISAASRHYIHTCILPDKDLPVPVQYNHWFGIGPDLDQALFLQQIPVAKDMGCEYMVMDAGWYGDCARGDFECGVGNWEVIDHDKFPTGLDECFQAVCDAGMKPGIWFEPERAHRLSHWAQQKSHLFWDIGGDYLHLNYSLLESQNAVIDLISNAISQYQLEYIKLDYNFGIKPYLDVFDPSYKIMFAYYDGLCTVMSTLHKRHPTVVFEACASGGRRIDLMQLRHSHTSLGSDQVSNDEVCRFMQIGANHMLPSSAVSFGIAFGTNENGVTYQPLRPYHLLCRMMGGMALFGNIAQLSADAVALCRTSIEIFKQYRHLLSASMIPLLPQAQRNHEWDAIEFIQQRVDYTSHTNHADEALVFVFSGFENSPQQQRFQIAELDPQGQYQITSVFGPAYTIQASGDALMNSGIEITLAQRDGMLLHIQKVVL